mmetsp:Transcript_72840/g.160797  ORF Transcript_72840/g.160797 Transcript_72840/m.160797 type:complete len:241 (+) Transcript_72840:76-798(+)
MKGWGTVLLLAPLAPLVQAAKLLRGDTPECLCAQNAVASASMRSPREAGTALVQNGRQSPQALGMPFTAPPLPELKVPPAVPKPPGGPLPPPAPPGIPALPPVPNVDPEDIHLQSMEGANLQSWYTVPPTVAALANLTQARPPLSPMTPLVRPDANELMPRFLPVPQDAQEMPTWAKNAYLPGYSQQAWRPAMPSWPTLPTPATLPGAPAAAAPAPAPAGFLQKAGEPAPKLGRAHCPCK